MARRFRGAWAVAGLAALVLAGCGGGDGGTDPGPADGAADADEGTADDGGARPDAAPDEGAPDGGADAGEDPATDPATDGEPPRDAAGDGTGDDGDGQDDAGDGGATDAWQVPDGFPEALPVEFTRPGDGEPIPDAEVAAFTDRVLAFLDQVRYFDHLLYTTHGVDASTGRPDWQFWYNERFRKEGDKVTFYHPVNLTDGGHNLHIPFSRALGDTVAAWLLTGDATAALAAEKMCKGMSASMLGFARDDQDPWPFVMSRNVVPDFPQEFLTHDGRRKAVDPSGWYSDYTRWNCSRFHYPDNPLTGGSWVTSLRSKDDLPHVFRLVPILRHAAAQGPEGATREACGKALDLLTAFAKDIVDSDYRIRTKDADGKAFFPGYTGDATADAEWGDIATFTWWRDVIPEGECNARRGAELIAYHRPVNEDCGRGEPNAYDEISFLSNGYNKRIARFFHLAHVANALASWDTAAAALLLDGLDQRVAVDEELGRTQTHYTAAVWERDTAVFLVQGHAYGFPLTAREARRVMDHYGRALDEMAAWPYWDPWAPTVPEGELGGYRPPSCKGEGAGQQCWFGVEDLAQVFETCWSPYVNPSGARWVDCDRVRAWRAAR